MTGHDGAQGVRGCSCPLPGLDISLHHAEERMSCWHCILWESIEQMRGTLCQLLVQVVTFKDQLTTGDTHLRHGAEGSTRVISHQLRRDRRMGDPRRIEPIASTLRFRMELRQVCTDR